MPGLYASISSAAAALVAVIGAMVLIGWYWNISTLKSVLPGLVSMMPNTAWGLVLAGAALFTSNAQSSPWIARLGPVLAAATLVLGALTIAEYISGLDLGIDQLLFVANRGDPSTSSPGRMAPITATCLTLGGIAVLLLNKRPLLAQLATLPVLALTAISILGYIFGVRSFYTVSGFTSVALHTAIALLILAIGILLARATRGFMDILAGATLGGVMFRRLLFFPILLLALGWLAWQGSRMGFYDVQLCLALMVLAGSASWLVATGIVARVLSASDGQRQIPIRPRWSAFSRWCQHRDRSAR